MIQITQLKLPYAHTAADLENKIRKTLHLSQSTKITYKIVKKSIDARKKPEIWYVYVVDVKVNSEKEVLKKAKNLQTALAED